MSTVAFYWIGLVAVIHVIAAAAEMLFWPMIAPRLVRGGADEGFIRKTRPMMANQGFYNLFLVAGLVWAMAIWGDPFARDVAVCFLGFVFAAGLFGAATVSRNIAFVQSVPAAIGIVLVLLS